VSDADATPEVLVYDYERAALALGVSASFLRKQVMAGRINAQQARSLRAIHEGSLGRIPGGHRATDGCSASSPSPLGPMVLSVCLVMSIANR
jgi:hypothetical protein